MKKRVMLILSCLFLSIGFILAQTTTISGTVVDNNGESVIGASVVVKGTTIGVSTGLNGEFSIDIPDGKKTLVFTLVGMNTVESVATQGMKVVMSDKETALDEVMVIAYGTVKKESFTGAANAINQNVIKDVPVMSFEQALQGAAPGMMITSSSGQPGAQQKINIRGVGSINASTEPLYVIDGVPMAPENISVSGVSNSPGSLGISSLINPADIANITVLKDAAATSLYGSRAANGVILITTKTGKPSASGKARVSFKAQLGFNDWAVENRPIVSGEQLTELWQEGYYNYLDNYYTTQLALGKIPEMPTSSQMWDETRADTDMYLSKPAGGYTDWEKELFRSSGFTQNYEANVAGGDAKTQFFVSIGYRSQDGKAKNSYSQQYSGRVNLTHSINDRFKVGTNVSATKMKQERVAEGTAYANPYYSSRSYLWPTIPVYNEDGTYYTGPKLNGRDNLAQSNNVDKYPQDVFDMRASFWGEYNIYDNLKFKQTLNYTRTTNDATTQWPTSGGNGRNTGGTAIKYSTTSASYYTSSILTYDKTINLHSFDVLAGWDVERRDKSVLRASAQNFASDQSMDLGGGIPTDAFSLKEPDRMLSMLSRANYNYDNKYYASASFRRDGSSRLGKNVQWGNFWSASAAWRISAESFMKNLTFLDDLKLRLSYGESGTLPLDWFEGQATYTTYDYYSGSAIIYPARIANPDLSWEKAQTLNFGLDIRLFNALSIEMDIYDRKTSDLILPVPVSLTTGFGNYLSNEGEMSNKGIEVAIGYDVFQTKDFYWNTRLNFAHNKNKVTKLYGGTEIIPSGTDNRTSFITRVGESYSSIYLREYAGYNTETGAEQWYTNTLLEDGTRDRTITENPASAQRVIVGNADPKLTGGWQNTFTYKGFSLSALFSFSFGSKFYDNGWSSTSDGLYDFTNLPSKAQLSRWQKPGDKAKFGKRTYGYSYGNYSSSKWVYDNDYIRLKNISLSYSLPTNLVKKADLSAVRFIISGNNIWTPKHTKGFDPESVDEFNKIGYALPPLKDITFGIEVNF